MIFVSGKCIKPKYIEYTFCMCVSMCTLTYTHTHHRAPSNHGAYTRRVLNV